MAEDGVIVDVEQVSKKYCRSLKRSMLYGVYDIGRNVVGLSSGSGSLRKDEFWAVNDVSFRLAKGETLGVIGRNGSGKTTLLKMLNGIFWPDKGRITIKGRVGSLIEVGAGFHPSLTGRENIYINSAILGMTRKEVDRKLEDIIEFADIGDFIDVPVKYYSTGMFIRLGFSIAIHSDPDLLLIDEILAVGDVAFRVKCYNRIAELTKQCAVVLVSHDMTAISRISSRCLVLNKGNNMFLGSPEEAVLFYSSIYEEGETTVSGHDIRVIRCETKAPREGRYHVLPAGDVFDLDLEVDSAVEEESIIVMVTFLHSSGEFVAELNSWYQGQDLALKKGPQRFAITVGPLWLNPGIYHLSLVVTSKNKMEHLLFMYKGWSLKMVGERLGNVQCQMGGSIVHKV